MQRLCGGGLRHYLGNGSEADIARQAETPAGCRQISTARGRESGSAVRSHALGDGREVSRGHSTAIENRGAGIRPFKLGNPPARSGKDRTDTMGRPGHPSCNVNPDRECSACRNRSRAEHRAERVSLTNQSHQTESGKESPCESAAVPQGEAADVRHLRVR